MIKLGSKCLWKFLGILSHFSLETNENKPIDHVAAEEVAEEEIDENSAESKVVEDRISNKEVEEQPNSELVRKKFFINEKFITQNLENILGMKTFYILASIF